MPEPAKAHDKPEIRGLLIDIDGVVTVGGAALPGSLEAIALLHERGIAHKFITNTTRRPRSRIAESLARLGLRIEDKDIFTPAILARDYLARHNLKPFLVVHPGLFEDFAGLEGGKEAVVIGDAGEFFTYDLLNRAFRKLIHGAPFLALAKNRNFLDRDGELSLDAGPFVAGLEYASGRNATVLGKPSRAFFALAVESLGCKASEAAMIGDDAEADAAGAMAAGLHGVLVRTGKYRPGQETGLAQPPSLIADDLKAAIEYLTA
ncbi:MAG TPA: TIGR01458 family HAD-type hydrolase [Methylocella sp.]|nr:TIGR01458 family HAD-type hydrolase [Methylocella sp.]